MRGCSLISSKILSSMSAINKIACREANFVPIAAPLHQLLVRSENRIDILNAKSFGKEYLNVFIMTVPFWDPIKKFRRSHQRCSIKKLFLKIPQYLQETICVEVPATLLKRDSNVGVFLSILRIF